MKVRVARELFGGATIGAILTAIGVLLARGHSFEAVFALLLNVVIVAGSLCALFFFARATLTLVRKLGITAQPAVSKETFQNLQAEVAALKKQERMIVRERNWLAAIIDSVAGYALSIQNTEYDIIYQNKTTRDFAEGLGQKCYRVYEGNETVCPGCPVQKAFADGRPHTSLRKVKVPSGEIYYWENTATVIRDERGTIISCLEICKNVTAREKAKKERELLNASLERVNKKLQQQALKDSQTGLYNYRYLDQVTRKEFERAKRHAQPFALLMLDVDYFKAINDVYGHRFGDLVLGQFAELLMRQGRRSDTVARFGGEEFVVLSPNTARQQAMITAQRYFDVISGHSFGDARHPLKLKVSIAVVSFPEDKVASATGLLKMADQVLRRVKEDGGNQIYSTGSLQSELPGLSSASQMSTRGSTDVAFLKDKLKKLTKRANQSVIEAICAFAKTIDQKDQYTGELVERTVSYATETARSLKMSEADIENVKLATTLHDIGKAGIPDAVLLRKGPLTKPEIDEIKQHPQIGVEIIRPIEFLRHLIPLILYHHERWDGHGYPKGLRKDQIPLGAQIVAVAAAFHSLTSSRPYRQAKTKAEAVRLLKAGAGTQFDPRIVDAFVKVVERNRSKKAAVPS